MDSNLVSAPRVARTHLRFALAAFLLLACFASLGRGQAYLDDFDEAVDKHFGTGLASVTSLKIQLEIPGGFIVTGTAAAPGEGGTYLERPFVAKVLLIFFVPIVFELDVLEPPGGSNAAPPPHTTAAFSATPAAVPEDAEGSGTSISRDGTAVVGFIDNGPGTPNHAFRSTAETGLVDLGTLDPLNNASRSSYGLDLSSDGTVVIGFSDTTGGSALPHAFRWTEAGGMADLGTGAGSGTDRSSRAFAVSGDGAIVVGESHFDGSSGLLSQAFRWTEAGGFQKPRRAPAGSRFGRQCEPRPTARSWSACRG